MITISNIFTTFEYVGLIASIIYIILAALAHRATWIANGIGSFAYMFVFFHNHLYFLSFLYLFYFFLGIYAWFSWKKDSKAHDLPIKTLGLLPNIALVIAFSLLAFLLSRFNDFLLQGSFPFWDSFAAVFSILAMILTVRKVIDSWIYWLVIDCITSVIYWYTGLYSVIALNIVLISVAVFGFFHWLSLMRRQRTLVSSDNA